MTDKQIVTYCDDVKETVLRQFYKIQNQRKEISLLHKKCTLQQAEIERLSNSAKQWEETAKDLLLSKEKAVAESIKEFVEKLKEDLKSNNYIVSFDRIDNLVKEMVGDDK